MSAVAQRYAAFLRGINVNGVKIRMPDLKAAFEDLGFGAVKTVLATGNVLFESERSDAAAIKREIEAALSRRFDYEAWIVLLDRETVQDIVDASPFARGRADWHSYVVLASDPAALDELARLGPTLDPATERVQPGAGVLYWEVLKGQTTESAFGKALSRPKYRASTTTRNLNTLEKLR